MQYQHTLHPIRITAAATPMEAPMTTSFLVPEVEVVASVTGGLYVQVSLFWLVTPVDGVTVLIGVAVPPVFEGLIVL